MLPASVRDLPHLCAAWVNARHVPAAPGDVVVVVDYPRVAQEPSRSVLVAGPPAAIARLTRTAGLRADVIAVAGADGALQPPRRATD